MADLKRIAFIAISVRGNGTDKQFTFVLTATPYWYRAPVSSATVLQAAFTLGSLLPTDVDEVSIDSSNTVTSAVIQTFGTELKVVFATAPPAGDRTVYATLIF